MCLTYIKSTTKNGLSMKLKCDLFNRLQNGERVESYVKVKNLDTPITNFIHSNKSLAKLTQLDLISKINLLTYQYVGCHCRDYAHLKLLDKKKMHKYQVHLMLQNQ